MAEYLERESILNAIRKTSDLYVDQQGLYLSCELIAAMPAVDVQPVKHGRWFHINNEGIVYCSECNNEAYWDTDYGQQLFDFCPYCGAKMIKDGEQK